MAIYKVKLEDDTLYDYEFEGRLEEVARVIETGSQFITCRDYRGKAYCVNTQYIKIIYGENE